MTHVKNIIIMKKYNQLTSEEEHVILRKGTEQPFKGEYDDFYLEGTYICRRCNLPLFSSRSKFDAGCGWPAFDGHYPLALKRIADPDEYRTEIECANCSGHLGHEFLGENLTTANTRECVNSLSILFIPQNNPLPGVIMHEKV